MKVAIDSQDCTRKRGCAQSKQNFMNLIDVGWVHTGNAFAMGSIKRESISDHPKGFGALADCTSANSFKRD